MLDAFLEMLAAERGAARHTIDAYRRDLADFAAFLRARSEALATAGGDAVRAYLEHLSVCGLAAATAARRLAAIRQFYRFLYLEGRRGDDPTTHIDTPKLGRRLPKLLEEEGSRP
jgi:integrase/recombinase XerD